MGCILISLIVMFQIHLIGLFMLSYVVWCLIREMDVMANERGEMRKSSPKREGLGQLISLCSPLSSLAEFNK